MGLASSDPGWKVADVARTTGEGHNLVIFVSDGRTNTFMLLPDS